MLSMVPLVTLQQKNMKKITVLFIALVMAQLAMTAKPALDNKNPVIVQNKEENETPERPRGEEESIEVFIEVEMESIIVGSSFCGQIMFELQNISTGEVLSYSYYNTPGVTSCFPLLEGNWIVTISLENGEIYEAEITI